MTLERTSASDAELRKVPSTLVRAHGRQILFYATAGLLGGTFTCSRCGAAGRHPDVIDHEHDCSYRRDVPASR